jgi:TetR/AcrR family transcriptional regulator of autoinduction and epiphytic fitness
LNNGVSGRVRAGRPSRSNEVNATARIIDAATDLFATRGFAGTSMEQVAAACGAGKDTVYRRFPSKAALFEAVVTHAHRRAIDQVEQIPAEHGNALERLKALMLHLLQINMEPDLIAFKRITMSEAIVFANRGQIPTKPDPLMERLVDAVGNAQIDGFIQSGDPAAIAEHLIHCLVALPTSVAMMGGDDFASSSAVSGYFARTWTWLLSGVAVRSAQVL